MYSKKYTDNEQSQPKTPNMSISKLNLIEASPNYSKGSASTKSSGKMSASMDLSAVPLSPPFSPPLKLNSHKKKQLSQAFESDQFTTGLVIP